MRALVIDEKVKADVAGIVAFASKPENYYLAGPGGRVAPGSEPGRNSKHVIFINSYRCVFSYTKLEHGLVRHLSISVPGKLYPNPVAACTIAELFGFRGWDGNMSSIDLPKTWITRIIEDEHCLVIAQKIGD